VTATDLDTGSEVPVPAGCVFFPAGDPLFTSGTNGLASGNSLEEATVHALAEVVERDTRTFQRLRNTSRLVHNHTLPAPLAAIAEGVASIGLRLTVRATLGDAGIPYFHAMLHEPGAREGLQDGWGCHPWAAIAATRAVCEAFQSRLSLIHGGRDDLAGQKDRLGAITAEARTASLGNAARLHAADPAPVDFATIGDRSAESPTLADVYRVLREAVRPLGGGAPRRVTLTPPGSPIVVAKVIVPRLENWVTDVNARMGPRLRAALGR
jgi:ribosomal protein S12 methylthiotransferase accessory factor